MILGNLNTMKQYTTSIIITMVAISVLGYLLYRDAKRDEQMAVLIGRLESSGTESSGRREQDPYLQNQVKNRIIKGYGDLQECYKDYLTGNPKTTDGNVTMDWQVDKGGDVISPEIVVSSYSSDLFHNCMKDRIASWKFPPPYLQKYIVHTFKFERKDK